MRPSPVPMMPGVSNLYTLLDLIRDPDRFQAEIEKLEVLRADANTAIEKAGVAGEIESLLEEAKVKRAETEAALAAARDEAKKIADEAGADLARRIKALDSLEADLNKRAGDLDERDAACKVMERRLDNQSTSLETREQAVAKAEQRAAQAEEKAQALKADYEAKLRNLKSVMGKG